MKRKEAVETIEFAKTYISKDGLIKQALDLALTALRPVSRGQVEKVWRGEWIDTNHRTSSCKCTKCGAVQEYETPFCPACGAPMTDEAMQMVMERMEALYVERNDG